MGLKVIFPVATGLSLLAASFLSAATIHVPTDQPTIQAGIDAAVNGDTVLVAPGTYNEALDYLGKDISVISSGGPEATVIERADGQSAIARFASGESNGAMLAGFKLLGESSGFQVYIENSSPTIERNHFVEHAGTSQENVCLRITGNSHPMVRRNLFYNNAACWGIVWSDADSINFINNTINSGVRGLVVYSSNSVIKNNIVTNCSYYGLWTNNRPMIRQYNDFWNNNPNYERDLLPDPTDISADPLFLDPSNDDYSLDNLSPCIDAGDPSPEHNDPDGTRNDMGAIPFAFHYGPVIYVSPNGSDSTGDGSEQNPFATIQFAVDVSSAGDTIQLLAGTYTGNGNRGVSIDSKNVTIRGEGSETTTIDIQNAPVYGFVFETDTAVLESRLERISIRNGNQAITMYNHSVVIADVRVAQCGTGIESEGSSELHGVIIDSCTCGVRVLEPDHGTLSMDSCSVTYCNRGIEIQGWYWQGLGVIFSGGRIANCAIAYSGGWDPGAANFNNSTFEDNSLSLTGGGTATSCTFLGGQQVVRGIFGHEILLDSCNISGIGGVAITVISDGKNYRAKSPAHTTDATGNVTLRHCTIHDCAGDVAMTFPRCMVQS